jgi:hypothetical protein
VRIDPKSVFGGGLLRFASVLGLPFSEFPMKSGANGPDFADSDVCGDKSVKGGGLDGGAWRIVEKKWSATGQK